MLRAFHFFDIVKAANRHGVRAIRQTTQYTWHHQTDITGIISIAEGFPFDVFSAVKVVTDILDGGHILHRILQEEFRAGRADKRHMRCGRYFGDITQQRHILC
ncbi:hypothetical protein D3C80_1021370 [compost metagenome]